MDIENENGIDINEYKQEQIHSNVDEFKPNQCDIDELEDGEIREDDNAQINESNNNSMKETLNTQSFVINMNMRY